MALSTQVALWPFAAWKFAARLDGLRLRPKSCPKCHTNRVFFHPVWLAASQFTRASSSPVGLVLWPIWSQRKGRRQSSAGLFAFCSSNHRELLQVGEEWLHCGGVLVVDWHVKRAAAHSPCQSAFVCGRQAKTVWPGKRQTVFLLSACLHLTPLAANEPPGSEKRKELVPFPLQFPNEARLIPPGRKLHIVSSRKLCSAANCGRPALLWHYFGRHFGARNNENRPQMSTWSCQFSPKI